MKETISSGSRVLLLNFVTDNQARFHRFYVTVLYIACLRYHHSLNSRRYFYRKTKELGLIVCYIMLSSSKLSLKDSGTKPDCLLLHHANYNRKTLEPRRIICYIMLSSSKLSQKDSKIKTDCFLLHHAELKQIVTGRLWNQAGLLVTSC